MTATVDLMRAEDWAAHLGLSAAPLDAGERRRFVMLNGSRGNFCLDLDETPPADEYARSAAWSADVGHYVHVSSDRVTVHRWDRSSLEARPYRPEDIAKNLGSFQQLLERADPDRERSIVRFVANLYGVLRSALAHESYPGESLRAFLVLLACSVSGEYKEELITSDWGLPEDALTAANKISTPQWKSLTDALKSGRPDERLQPYLRYMLRHAAGQVFQEAHSVAVLDQQTFLFSEMLPDAATLGQKLAISSGVYFTPPHLARTLVEQAASEHLGAPALTVFDPACGSGEILGEFLRFCERMSFGGRIRIIGWDTSPMAVDMARFALEWERRNSLLPSVEVEISQQNSLAEDWPTDVDLVLMNPPFLSYEDLSSTEKHQMRTLLGTMIGQRPDLASAFLLRAERSVVAGGTVGSIIPSSILDNKTARALREHLAEDSKPVFIAKLGDLKLFQDAIIDAGIYVSRKNREVHGGKMLWASSSRPAISAALRTLRRYKGVAVARETFSIYPLPEDLDPSSWAPRPYESLELFNRYLQHPRVAKLFEVRQGVRTGENKVFVLTDEQYEKLPKKERAYFRDTIINKSLRNGRIVAPVHMFYPYGDKAINSEEELTKQLKRYSETYLFPNKQLLQRRAKTDPAFWWRLTWPRKDEVGPKIISTAFGRRGAFAFDDVGDRLVINGFVWYPRNKELFTNEIALGYIAILNSALFDNLLGATSRQVGGGQWDLQNRFVEPIPLPDLSHTRFPAAVRTALSDIGIALHSGTAPDELHWRNIVDQAYELSWLDDAFS